MHVATRSRTRRQKNRSTDDGPERATRRGYAPSAVDRLHRRAGNRAVQTLYERGGVRQTRSPGARADPERASEPTGDERGPTTRATAEATPTADLCPRCTRRYRSNRPLDCPKCEDAIRRPDAAPTPRRAVDDEVLQASLEVSHPDDPAEREAERVAEAVLRRTAPDGSPTGPAADEREAARRNLPRRGGSACSVCRSQPAGVPTVTRRARGADASRVDPATERRIDASRTGGSPLRPADRTFFEAGFGRDFSDVRIHTGSRADEAARSIDAEAFTIGTDVVFRRGAYEPGRERGTRLLAHELAHVVQQRPSPVVDPSRVRARPNDGVVYRAAPAAAVGAGAVALWCLKGAGVTTAVDLGIQLLKMGWSGDLEVNGCRILVSALLGCVFGMVGGAVQRYILVELGGTVEAGTIVLQLDEFGAWLASVGIPGVSGKWAGSFISKLGCEGRMTVEFGELETSGEDLLNDLIDALERKKEELESGGPSFDDPTRERPSSGHVPF